MKYRYDHVILIDQILKKEPFRLELLQRLGISEGYTEKSSPFYTLFGRPFMAMETKIQDILLRLLRKFDQKGVLPLTAAVPLSVILQKNTDFRLTPVEVSALKDMLILSRGPQGMLKGSPGETLGSKTLGKWTKIVDSAWLTNGLAKYLLSINLIDKEESKLARKLNRAKVPFIGPLPLKSSFPKKKKVTLLREIVRK